MPVFTAVDADKRLWAVKDLLTPEQVNDLLSLDWLNLPWTKGSQQYNWHRRQINWNYPEVERISRYISNQLPAINSALGTNFDTCGGHFWVDEPGFTVPMHTDGELPNAMQLYWHIPNENYGTGFYYNKNGDRLLHQFLSQPNTGYIMLNHLNDNGSQPLYWHQMINPVPEGSIRVSSYWRFDYK